MNQEYFIDTHTHTLFWEDKHFKTIDSAIKILSLDCYFTMPFTINLRECTDNIINGYGIQPHTNYDRKKFYLFLDDLVKKIEIGKISYLGELGLNYCNKNEKEVLFEQLNIASEYNIPCVVHTPHINKKNTTKEIINILDLAKIDPNLILMDHIYVKT